MKKLLMICLFSTLLFSLPASAEWSNTGQSSTMSFFVDFERNKKNGDHLYYWQLSNYLKPFHGKSSAVSYNQADCNLFRFKTLQVTFFTEQMGHGESKVPHEDAMEYKWVYPPPKSASESVLKAICRR